MHDRIEKGQVKVYIDGEEIPLVPFVNNIIADTVKGIVSNVRGYKKDGEIVIKISPGS